MTSILPPSQGPGATPGADTPTSVYRYYDAGDLLIYVGITSRGVSRNREHNTDKAWWSYVARQEVEHYPTRAAALAREKRLIQEYRPPFNRQHNPDHADLSLAYGQFRAVHADADLDPVALVRNLNGMLPLVGVPLSDMSLPGVLRTLPEHAGIAVRLRPRVDGVAVQGTGRGSGRIQAVVHQGPVALLRMSARTARPIAHAIGYLKLPPAKPLGSIVELRAVHVSLEPREGACSRCERDVSADGLCRKHLVDRIVQDGAA